MASLAKVVRSGAGLIRTSTALVNASRPISFTAVQNKDWKLNDPIDHATGLEKYELLQEQAGNDDPFFMKATKRGTGTKDNPNIVNALDNYRMVGCVCNEDDTNIKWMWVIEGKDKRCKCGYYFRLNRHEPPSGESLPL